MYHRATEAFHKGLRIVKTPPVLNRVSRLLPIVQLSLFLWITYSLVQAVLLNKGNAKKFSNHYCMENQIECALDYKFDKVVYMWVDGVSWDTAGPIFDVFNSSGHMNLMRVKHDSAPWSGAVFSTYITGKVTKNMAEVNADNIVNQFLLNGKKVFLGAQETIVYVLNNLRGFVDNAKLKFYPGVTSDDDTKAMYGWLFNCDNTKREELTDEKITTCVNKVLGGAKIDDRSFFMESFYVDHKIHYEVPTRFDATAINAIQEFSYNVKFLKNWIDNNPEYLLVIVTDHGGKGSSGESVHGSWTDPNNYAWNLYYNPQLKPIQDYPIINTGDVATTMWQYFAGSGISIPAESVGITAPITDNKENYMKSLKANALQLKAYAKHINLKLNKDLPKPSDDQEQTISNLLEFNTKLSEALKDQKDVKLVIILTAISFCFQLYFLYRLQLTNFFDEIAKTGFLFIVAPYVAWVMLSNWTAGWMWDVLGTDNYNIYYYIILMVTVGATALSSKPRLSNSNDVPLTKNSSSSYVSLKVYSECDTSSKEEEEVAVFSEKILYKNETAWEAVREKRVKDVVKYGIEHILGLTPLESTKSKYWMVWFAVCFGIIGALMKGMIHQNFLGLTDVGYVQNHINIRMWIAFLILFMEFRWQRRLLTTFLKQRYEESQNILLRVFDPAYFPMYIKFALYIFVFSVIFIYEKTIENGKINFELPWIVYYIVVMHSVILLFSPTYLQRDLLLPIFALHLIVQTNLEQVMTCTFVLCLHPLSNALLQIYDHKDTKTKIQAVPNKHVVAYLIVIMFAMSQFYFFFMENGSYTINELNLDVAGMRDTTLYPKLSVLIIAYHKLSCFIILVPFLIRLACPNLPDMKVLIIFGFRFGAVPITNRNKTASLNINHTLVWNVLLAFGQISTLFFLIAMTTELKDASFFWTITIITTVCLYGVTELSSKGGEFIVDLFKMLKLKIVQNK